jgi:uncharacterized membrane-anchored protein
MKMTYKFDEEKIRDEKKYDLEQMYDYIFRLADFSNLERKSKNELIGEFAGIGVMVYDLQFKDWFIENATEWLLWIKDDYDKEWECEDLLNSVLEEKYAKRKAASGC